MYGFRNISVDGAPASGTAGTFAGHMEPGGFLFDKTNGVLYFNEGLTAASPYYTPAGFNQHALFGVSTDFRDTTGKAHADTAAAAFLGSGLRVFGQGIAETDSGMVANAAGEGGRTTRLTTTDEDAHNVAIGMDAGVMQPDQHQLLVIDARVSHVSAITLRRMFCGFLGTAADAVDPPVTGATVTLTLVQDDLAGLFFDSAMTDASRLFAPHNKSDEAATLASTATGVDTGVNIAAAATYTRLRVEISAAGVMRCFVNKVLVTTIAAAVDVDEELSPALIIGSNSAAVKAMDVSHFATWAYR